MSTVVPVGTPPPPTDLPLYVEVVELQQMHRCDAGSAARAEVEWTHRVTLLRLKLCRHHSREHANRMLAAGWVVTEPSLSVRR